MQAAGAATRLQGVLQGRQRRGLGGARALAGLWVAELRNRSQTGTGPGRRHLSNARNTKAGASSRVRRGR